MAGTLTKKILSNCPQGQFVGRDRELAELVRHSSVPGGLLLLAEPGSGTTELLLQTYDRLFKDQKEITPIYFSFGHGDASPTDAAKRFFRELLLQIAAFRRRDPVLLHSGLELKEILLKAAPHDANIFTGLKNYFGKRPEKEEPAAYFRRTFNAPIRAAAAGLRLFVMFDAVHHLDRFDGGKVPFESLIRAFAGSQVPFIFAGNRRRLFAATNVRSLPLERLSFRDAGKAIESLASRRNVSINEETRDLIAVQLGRDLSLVETFLSSAAEQDRPLDSFQRVQQHYANEIFGGRIARRFDASLNRIVPNSESRQNILGLLHDAGEFKDQKLSSSTWMKQSSLAEVDARRVLGAFNENEFVRVNSCRVEAMHENAVLHDYLAARFGLEVAGENRASLFGRTLTGFIKRAPQIMSRFYRQMSAIGVREILSGFSGETLPAALIDYSKFAGEYKGAQEGAIFDDLRRSDDTIRLPNIVFAAHTTALYEPLGQVTETERSAVGYGFNDVSYTNESEIIWIVAEIDSKLEVARDHTEFWCDRLEMAALMCDLAPYRIWLIAPEGFSPDAQGILKQRNALGSSKRQVRLMQQFLKQGVSERDENAEEYEITLPMDEDAELVAANVVEEIAKRHNFGAKAINQIKTALIEAFINAAEHSLSPDRRVHQKFTVDDRRLTITISNRGVRLTDSAVGPSESSEARRGWGLNLMRRLMDEVTIEDTDDGTRISMTKFLTTV
jgi:serine/threonine-protein kinase RsbW